MRKMKHQETVCNKEQTMDKAGLKTTAKKNKKLKHLEDSFEKDQSVI